MTTSKLIMDYRDFRKHGLNPIDRQRAIIEADKDKCLGKPIYTYDAWRIVSWDRTLTNQEIYTMFKTGKAPK